MAVIATHDSAHLIDVRHSNSKPRRRITLPLRWRMLESDGRTRRMREDTTEFITSGEGHALIVRFDSRRRHMGDHGRRGSGHVRTDRSEGINHLEGRWREETRL